VWRTDAPSPATTRTLREDFNVINAPRLLADLTRQLKSLEADLRQRIDEHAALEAGLRAEWQAACDANRCAETFQTWVDQVITQAGVHWLLSCVFLRFIEDNQLVDRPWLAGPPDSGRLALAHDRHEAYFRAHPHESDRDYLLAAFREAGSLPGLQTFFDETHNPVFRLGISGDAAMSLRQFWQQVDTDTGALLRDFTDASWNTRFLGDLYQDLSEATRKRYALLQTPEFVEEFILDRTLTPAIRTFGFRDVRMIDPTCGSGHFLLGGFSRLVDEWQRNEPARNPRDIAQRALEAVAGVDLNPFAVAISRFRLLVAALRVAGVQRLADAPDLQIRVAIGDSLLHGTRFGLTGTQSLLGNDQYAGTGLAHAYVTEDLVAVQRILDRQYHAVVGNPPYIVVEDSSLNSAYRARYASCQGQYSLGVPFTERFFDLAISNRGGSPGGYIGLITANSFMKREFGPRLVTQVLPIFDLTHVIDTSGAYIPGHGTPTVILFGRNRPPMGAHIRAVLGITGEPSRPENPATGAVWTSILDAVDCPGFENKFVSSSDFDRQRFRQHPWRTGGGGAAELSYWLDETSRSRLPQGSVVSGTGRTSADEGFVVPPGVPHRHNLEANAFGALVEGDLIRDWGLTSQDLVFAPYDEHGLVSAEAIPHSMRWLWPLRTTLGARITFGRTTYAQEGRPWWGWHQVTLDRLRYEHVVTYGEIATHNHFVVDYGGKVFKQTAPFVKLPTGSEDDHLGLLGLLNSSVACFWLKQVCHNKGGGGINEGHRGDMWEFFFAFNSSKVAEFPLPSDRPLSISRLIQGLQRRIAFESPATQLTNIAPPTRATLDAARDETCRLHRKMFAMQEELDWQCYCLYGLLPEGLAAADVEFSKPPELNLGERAFEIVLARRVATGDETTTWFERHGSTPITDLPAHWPAEYRAIVERRIALIQSDRNIGLIERPEFKRRWNTPAWDDVEKAALRDWLLDRLEQPTYWPASAERLPQLITTNRLADLARADTAFMQVAALYASHADFDPARLVAELVALEAVPLLPVQRYTNDGLRKRAQWDGTWALQRREDAIDAQVVANNADEWRREFAANARTTFGGDDTDEARVWIEQQLAAEIKRHQDERKTAEVRPIPVPPKYKSSDFLKAAETDYWRLRGGLDVPKERFVSFPGMERGADGSLPIAWAGWNHLQQATALAGYYVDMKDSDGWEPARLQPLLAGLLELVPWLKQWHNDVDANYGARMGDYYEGFVAEEARAQGFTLDDLRAWKPAATTARRGRRPRATA
jgi:hypothetical protein